MRAVETAVEEVESVSNKLAAEELQVLIGTKIKKLRKLKGFTLEEVAQRSKISRSSLSQIENNATSPSISQLLALSHVFDVDVVHFFRKENHEEFQLIRADERKRVTPTFANPNYPGYIHDYLITVRPSGPQRIFAVEIKALPPEDVEYNIHSGMELAIVLNGDVDFIAKDKKEENVIFHVVLRAGDVLCFPAKYPHSYRALGKPVNIIGIFFRTLAQDLGDEPEDVKHSEWSIGNNSTISS